MTAGNPKLTSWQFGGIFLKMGSQAFGGWSTTVLLIEKNFMARRNLLTKKQLDSAIASGQILPGAAQMIVVTQVAYYMRGIRGALIATTFYLLPSIALTITFSFIYFHFLSNSTLSSRTLGLQAAVAGIIVGNAYRIGKSNIHAPLLWFAVAPAALITLLLPTPTMYTILAYAFIGLVISFNKRGVKE